MADRTGERHGRAEPGGHAARPCAGGSAARVALLQLEPVNGILILKTSRESDDAWQ